MTQLNSHALSRIANTKATTAIFVACSSLIALGVATIIGESNHILYTTVNAQLEDAEELREELRASIAEELQGGLNQNQSDQSAAAANPNGLTLSLDRAHYIPLSPLSDSPGNQVKMLLDYTIENSSVLAEDTVSAVMEVYAENQTLLRTSSLPEPIVLDDSEGSIQLATTFDDPTLQNITARALLTDGQKINPLSDPIEASLGLGELKTEGTSDLE
ncbi:MAG: hypothetical protein GEU26_18795 [Nitrososphaeraceae archaeon]|nr:hypothetical protein [Nitrososphaeraceae archaeon]